MTMKNFSKGLFLQLQRPIDLFIKHDTLPVGLGIVLKA